MIVIRKERPQDTIDIRRINTDAFAGSSEALLIESLRENGKLLLSLVALVNNQPVGHILFSQMQIISPTSDTHNVVGLGPLAVLPEVQRQGIGSALCQKGIELCTKAGYRAILVLGHPTYYPRFGFKPAAPLSITCAYDVPSDAFMALELQEGGLDGVTGVAHYQPEFDGV